MVSTYTAWVYQVCLLIALSRTCFPIPFYVFFCVCVKKNIIQIHHCIQCKDLFSSAVYLAVIKETCLYENWASNLSFCHVGLSSVCVLHNSGYFIFIYFLFIKSIFFNFYVLWAINQNPSTLRSSFLWLWWKWPCLLTGVTVGKLESLCYLSLRVLLIKTSLSLSWTWIDF